MAERMQGLPVYDAAGRPLGRVAAVFAVQGSGMPEWLAITDPEGADGEVLAPVADARPAGGGVQIPYDTDVVRAAPYDAATSAETLPADAEERLVRYYGTAPSALAEPNAEAVLPVDEHEAPHDSGEDMLRGGTPGPPVRSPRGRHRKPRLLVRES